MSGFSPARKTAARVLEEVLYSGAHSNTLLNELASGLDPRDRALASALVYGVLKKVRALDAVISSLTEPSGSKPKKAVRIILFIGLFQLLYMDRVPAHAAVNEAAGEAAKIAGPGVAGFVNALMRKASAMGQAPLCPPDGDLETDYGFGPDVVRALEGAYSPGRIMEYARFVQSVPRIFVRVNTSKVTPERLRALLASQGVESRRADPGPVHALEITGGAGALFTCRAMREGLFYVQDLSGVISSDALGAGAGERVLDMCAAPGAKTFGALLAAPGVSCVSCDVSPAKLVILRENARRLGLRAQTAARDSRLPRPGWENSFDRVICDVPCSGLGVVSRRPEILLRFTAGSLSGLADVQTAVLCRAFSFLKPGGRLIYSTCTLTRRENEDVVEEFLRDNPSSSLIPVRLPYRDESDSGFLRLFGPDDGTDGFFAALIGKGAP